MENLRTHSLIEGQLNFGFRKSVTVCIKLTKAKAKGNVAACNCGSSAIVHPTCHVYNPCPCPQFIFVICQATCHRTWLLGLRLLRSRPFSWSCSAFWERKAVKYRRIPKARGANILKLFYINHVVIINHSPIAVFKLTRVFTGKHTEIFKFNRKHNDA